LKSTDTSVQRGGQTNTNFNPTGTNSDDGDECWEGEGEGDAEGDVEGEEEEEEEEWIEEEEEVVVVVETEEEEEPDAVMETLFPHTQTGWECGKKCYNIFVPTFIPTCWVKDIDLTTVSVVEIQWCVKCPTSQVLYYRNPMSPIYLLWDSSCKRIPQNVYSFVFNSRFLDS
jgi:hypothetical protein